MYENKLRGKKNNQTKGNVCVCTDSCGIVLGSQMSIFLVKTKENNLMLSLYYIYVFPWKLFSYLSRI